MRICVAYASRHGGTRGIADRLAETLRAGGVEADVSPVADLRDPGAYDALAIGSAVYLGGWLRDAEDFVRRNRAVLATKPVWLFSSGPLGTSLVDAQGRSALEAPKVVAELTRLVGARGDRVFFGAFDPAQPPAAMSERLVRMMPASKSLLPAGDFRAWDAIDAWGREILAAVQRETPVAAG